MTDRDRSDRLAEYVAVLRGFGLSDADICARHGLDPDDGADLVDRLDEPLETATEQSLYEHTHDAIAGSARGIDADREAEDHVPALAAVLDEQGWDLAVEDQGEDEDSLELTVTGSDGDARSGTFSYPDHPLGAGNLPALAHAVGSLLNGQTFVLLTEKDGRWRLVLLPEDDLDALRGDYGERIRVFRRPLLAADQPADFAEAVAGSDREDELAGLAGDAFAESFGTGPRVHRSSRPLDEDAGGSAEPKTVVGESVDEVFEAMADDAESADDPSTHTVSMDDDEPSEVGNSSSGSGDSLVGGTPRTTVVQGSVDDMFDDEEAADEDERPAAEAPSADTEAGDADDEPAAESADRSGPDAEAEQRVADLAAAAASVGPSKTPDDEAEDTAEDEEDASEAVDSAGEDSESADEVEPEPVADSVADEEDVAAPDAESPEPPEAETVGDAAPEPAPAETPAADPEATPATDDEPEDTPSISDVELDVDDFEEPDLGDGESNTDGPLAGNLGGPAIEEAETGTGDAPADPSDAEPDDEGKSESSPGLLGRFSAWLRGLF
ncbi:hypothetical protein [Haloarchaeobius amylolyticus]|uniref:hypothetical protein n=1 Tax=Haloarchaeobius amylolyticus TaxID=1198296 RepID=UPI0022703BD5|nr:hypothetical protein [Haloarchaeobius amylolyticus]